MTEPHRHAEWSRVMFDMMREAGVTLFTHVPDAGNECLIQMAQADNAARTVLLTSEEEGIAMAAGADLVGGRAVLCMQSSGVGNCPNFLTLAKAARFPLLMMVTMRGDYGEQNPWQYSMGEAAVPILEAMGVLIFRVARRDELEGAVQAALHASGKGAQSAAIVLSQKFLGAKGF